MFYVIDKFISPLITLGINVINKRIGKIYFEVDQWSCKMGRYDENGDYKTVTNVKDAENGGIVNFQVNIYNSHEYSISLKKIRISFVKESHMYDYKLNSLDILNLEPKKMIDLKLECNLTKEDLMKINGYKAVYFKFKDHKNKEIKKIIKTF
ncbi:hypothetical protein [Clostridium scatologenes]|uniref:Uncharacterized protein n=1 Tax=Clostridium scatologenes TaxID=1548 RepID=A0A0E3M8P0_CLOSL|nr:hypothetical protein [Clostridium scatologenes]AKA71957.1 hypothetical protein CSCA_4832 [Clostridium scatologenes]